MVFLDRTRRIVSKNAKFRPKHALFSNNRPRKQIYVKKQLDQKNWILFYLRKKLTRLFNSNHAEKEEESICLLFEPFIPRSNHSNYQIFFHFFFESQEKNFRTSSIFQKLERLSFFPNEQCTRHQQRVSISTTTFFSFFRSLVAKK